MIIIDRLADGRRHRFIVSDERALGMASSQNVRKTKQSRIQNNPFIRFASFVRFASVMNVSCLRVCVNQFRLQKCLETLVLSFVYILIN